MKVALAAAATALGLGAALAAGVSATASDAAGPSPADVRYHRAVADAGYDPADPYWAAYARDTCANLRDGRSARESDGLAYVYGAAVGAYCSDQAARTWYAR